MDKSKFKSALPTVLQPWSDFLADCAEARGVSPWILAGLMMRETNGGQARGCKPLGARCTGDFTPRRVGTAYIQASGHVYRVGASGMPEDGQGWGRGLMQIDWGVHNEWCATHDWGDPRVNVDKAASIMQTNLAFFSAPANHSGVPIDGWRLLRGLPQYGIQPWLSKYGAGMPPGGRAVDPRPLAGAALENAANAAYNAGVGGVLQAVALGIPAEAACAGQDYVTWFTTRIAQWQRGVG